jgi:hypothetical protein
LKLSITCVAKDWEFFRDLCLDSSIGAGIGAKITTRTFLLIHPEIGIPGERGLWADFDTFFSLTGNT